MEKTAECNSNGKKHIIYEAKNSDIYTIANMAVKMWENHTPEDLAEEFEEIINNNDSAIFLMSTGEIPIGFAQCQLRHDYVEGTESSPVGYLEGIFIEKEYRKQGYAGELLKKCEKWALKKGCTEFASDCELTNDSSLKFHLKTGFTEANRIICFTKKIAE